MFFQFFGNIFIFYRYYPGQKFYHGNFCAHTVIEISKLYTYGTAAYNYHGFWLCGQRHCLAVTNYFFAILFKIGQFAAAGAGCYYNMFCFNGILATICLGYFYLAFGFQLAKTHDHINLILLHQELHAPAHFIGYTAAAFDNGCKILLAAGFNTIVFGVVYIIHYIGTLQQCFGRNATPVKTDSAQAFLFYDCCFKTQLCCADGCYIASGPATHNKNIVCHTIFYFSG